jgi:hypothetical protein
MTEAKMINETLTDINGRRLSRYTVRSTGQGFFIPVDKLTNTCPLANGDRLFTTREQAWDYLRETVA